MTIELVSDRNPIRLLVDTGASGLILFQGRVRLGPQVTGLSYSTNLGGAFPIQPVQLANVQLGDTRFRSLPAFLVDDPGLGREGVDGLMGTSPFYFRQIAFDFAHRVFSWEAERSEGAALVHRVQQPVRHGPRPAP